MIAMSLKQGHGENVEITHVLVSRTRKTRTLIETVLLETVYIYYYYLLRYYINNFNYIHHSSSLREKGGG